MPHPDTLEQPSVTDLLLSTSLLEAELLAKLKSLEFRQFEHCLVDVFSRLGYTHVRLTGRTYPRGRTRYRGFDIEATVQAGISSTKVLIQVKHYDVPIPAAFVDSLRGALLRHEAASGIIVSTSTFSPAAVKAARSSHVLPIRLVDGQALVRLMLRYRLGVKNALVLTRKLDESFFYSL